LKKFLLILALQAKKRMQLRNFRRDLVILALVFIVSRALMAAFGVHMEYFNLYDNWQYLDVETLTHNLWRGVWYDHAQPPVFNLFLGIVLKLTGSHAAAIFVVIFKGFTLLNTLLLYTLLGRVAPNRYIPLLISLLYILSPATMIFESELFYTSFITFFLLLSAFFLLRLQDTTAPEGSTHSQNAGKQDSSGWANSLGFFLPLVVACLTRSMYHLVWLGTISIILLFCLRKKAIFTKFLAVSLLAFALVGAWYIKNLVIFHQFSTSSWIGMNLARNVFHDENITDSSRIEAYEPFSDLRVYKPFIHWDYQRKYAGLNDRDLLQEKKNDTIKNVHQVDYIEVSKKYSAASIAYIKSHPATYLRNVAMSGMIFFATATRYPHEEYQVKKIWLYDLLYSFNFTHFANGKLQRRITLFISAVPKMILYALVFFILLRPSARKRSLTLLNIFIFSTILYIFALGSLIEHYENMRFRYEIEPLFLLLLGQAAWRVWQSRANIQKPHPAGPPGI
jgi:hypothetical protein